MNTVGLHDKFTDWIMQNYSVWNGDRLIQLEDDGDVQLAFLRDMGLPEDTEILP